MVKQILTAVFMCGVILITSPNIANANNYCYLIEFSHSHG